MNYWPLENAVMQALAWDLRDVVPDLAGQFEDSLPGARRNTGHSLFTEMIVNPRCPVPKVTPSGSFGTVHAMVGDLPGSMAFKVSLRDGVLLGLEGEAFDMETADIDFARTSFHTVFTVDDQGRSVRFDPAAVLARNPLSDLQTAETPPTRATYEDPPLVNLGALQRVQDAAKPSQRPMAAIAKADPPKLGESQTSLFIGLCTAIIAIALLAWWIFRVPLPVAAVLAFWLCRVFRNPKALAWASRTLAQLQVAIDAGVKAAQQPRTGR